MLVIIGDEEIEGKTVAIRDRRTREQYNLSEDEFRERLRVRAPLRFEYDPANAGEDHPASHLHLGRTDCRIPVSCPLSLDTFLRFIFKRFYRAEFASWDELSGIPHRSMKTTLTDVEKAELNVQL